jgi:hypothetical protein
MNKISPIEGRSFSFRRQISQSISVWFIDGRYVSLEFFRQYPSLVAGLILAATRSGADTAKGCANREKAIFKARQQGVISIVDSMLPKMLAQNMQTVIFNSTLRILQEAGHLLNLEQPDLFNQVILEFLAASYMVR